MRKKKSFTIIEILITMIIMGTISATVIPRIGDINERTDETVKKINETRDFACELGLDDMCTNGGSSSFDKDNSDGVHHSEKAGKIKVCKDGKCITMMDKNLGVSSSENVNPFFGVPNPGHHFQRGNGHGFTVCYDDLGEGRCAGFNSKGDLGTGEQKSDCDEYDSLHSFSDRTYIHGHSDYCETPNDDLRGGQLDSSRNNWGYDTENMVATNVTGRQGPCPNGYHIPSKGEWITLMNMYYDTSTNGESTSQVEDFQEAFKLPAAGYRLINAQLHYVGDAAAFRSSSPSGNGNARSFVVNLSSNKSVSANVSNPRASALSVRCFKNHNTTSIEEKKVEDIKLEDKDSPNMEKRK